MKKEETTFERFADLTDSRKAEIRKKYPNAIVIILPVNLEDKDLPDDEWIDTASYVITPADRAVNAMVEKYAAEKNFKKFKEVLIKNCVIAGDMEHLDEDRNIFVYKSVLNKCADLMGVAKAKVAKL